MNGLTHSSTPDDSLPYEVWLVYDDGRPDEFINACRYRSGAQAFLDEWTHDDRYEYETLGVKPVIRERIISATGLADETIRQRVALRDELQATLGEQFAVDYHPSATAGDDETGATRGHMVEVTFYSELEPVTGIDAREADPAGQVAAWLRRKAEELTAIAARIDAAKGGAT
jgi:hypothetical protein